MYTPPSPNICPRAYDKKFCVQEEWNVFHVEIAIYLIQKEFQFAAYSEYHIDISRACAYGFLFACLITLLVKNK